MSSIEFFRGFIVLVLLFGIICSGVILTKKGSRKRTFLYIFDSRNPENQFNLYFGIVSLFSMFIYTAYATLINNMPFNAASFGEGISIIFVGIGICSVGQGLQTKNDPEGKLNSYANSQPKPNIERVPEGIDKAQPRNPVSIITDAITTDNFIQKLTNGNDRSVEMHLFLGLLSIIIIILYQGYDLVYIDKTDFSPESYGTSLAYVFGGIGAASWGQGVQRKYQTEKPKRVKTDKPKDATNV